MTSAPKIKVCHLTSVHSAYDTRILFKECLSLSEEYEVTLIAPHSKKEHFKGVQIIPLKTYGNRLFRFLFTDIQLLFNAMGVNAKVYHFHDPELIPIGFILRLFGKKIIYDVHEDVRADLKQKHWLPLKGLFAGVYELMDKLAQKLFFIVLAERSYVNYYGNSRFVIVQNFVQPELFNSLQKTDFQPSDTILLVGTLAGKRGLDKVIPALALLKKEGIKLKLVCVGKYENRLKQMLDNMPEYQDVNEQITFTGHKPVLEAYTHAKTCLAGIALPDDRPNHRESYPTKMFEYMACGLPVIASDFPLYREVIDKYKSGICVNPDDVNAIAEALKYFYDNQQQAFEMGRRSKEAVVKEFSWEVEKQKLLAFYKEVLG